MKRFFALMLALLLMILCGCSKSGDEEDVVREDYIVNDNEVVKIGVLTPLSGDDAVIGKEVLEGVEYACKLHDNIHINRKKYSIELVTSDTADDINKFAEKIIDEKAAAVICYAGNYDTTNNVIDAFKTVNTPLLFVDNNSEKIAETVNSISMTMSSEYQSSVLSSYLFGEGKKSGTVVYEDNEYYKNYAETFGHLFEKNSGASVDLIAYSDDINISDSSQFAFVIGNNSFCVSASKSLKDNNSDLLLILPEIYDNSLVSSSEFDGCIFLSKFEADSENNMVTDFINACVKLEGKSDSDISAAFAYGYATYNAIYGALGDQTSYGNTNDPLNAVKNDTENKSDDVKEISISTSQLLETIKTKLEIQYGVIDFLKFDENGILKPTYVFVDGVEYGKPYVINKFKF